MRWTDRIGRRLKLRDLHIVMAVAEAGSMSRAADRLAISHPVVSKTIGDLEHALGVRLFDRTAQGTELTQYGRSLLSGGTVVFDELRRVMQEIAFLSDPTVDAVTLCGMLRERKLDVVIGRVPASVFGEDLTSEFLFDDELHVVAGVKSPSARRRRIALANLCSEPWLMPESDNCDTPAPGSALSLTYFICTLMYSKSLVSIFSTWRLSAFW